MELFKLNQIAEMFKPASLNAYKIKAKLLQVAG